MGLSQAFSILLFFYKKKFLREPCVGNRVRFSVRLLVRKGGGPSLYDPDPDKPFKINRVPASVKICSGLALRTKKPSAKAGRFRLVRVARFM